MRPTSVQHVLGRWLVGLLVTMCHATGYVSVASPAPAWEHCLQQEAASLDIHSALFRALIYSESRNHPLALAWTDQQGSHHSVYPATEQEARALMTRLLQKEHRLDAGLGQINSVHFARVDRPSDLLSPCTNLHVAGLVLRENLERHGYTWQALAGYNGSVGSSTYIELVYRNLCRRSPDVCEAYSHRPGQHPAATDPLPLRPQQPVAVSTSTPLGTEAEVKASDPMSEESPSTMLPSVEPSTGGPNQETPMTFVETLSEAFPGTVMILTFCLRILLPFLIFLGFVLIVSYGIQLMCWALGLARDSVGALMRGRRPAFPGLRRSWTPQPIPAMADRSLSARTYRDRLGDPPRG